MARALSPCLARVLPEDEEKPLSLMGESCSKNGKYIVNFLPV